MQKLSRYVFETQNKLYNSMNKIYLEKNSSELLLKENFFLSGQEKDSLEKRLFKKPEMLQLRIIPTWECNLRCNHCSVLSNLKINDPCLIEKKDVLNFCKSHLERYNHSKIRISFIGGECLIQASLCLEIVKLISNLNVDFECNLTTNLACDLTIEAIELLEKTSQFTVSLDGDEEQHNWQRKSINKNINPYKKTVANIKRCILLGFSDKMTVQAAVQEKQFDETKKEQYYKFLLKLGVKNIVYGSCHPTIQNPDLDKGYVDYLKSGSISNAPCCEYRFMRFFTINSKNELSSEYYTAENKFGNLKDFDFDFIENIYKNKIKNNMSILKDETCMNECPVVAYCWGKCVNHELYNKDFAEQPSKYCDREKLIKKIRNLAFQEKL